jgi:hypothetical protein
VAKISGDAEGAVLLALFLLLQCGRKLCTNVHYKVGRSLRAEVVRAAMVRPASFGLLDFFRKIQN